MITYGTPRQIDPVTWLLPVTTDATLPATLRIYRDGVLYQVLTTQTGREELVLPVAAGTSPYVEVLDTACRRKPASPGRFTVHWLGVAGATRYRVEELVGGEWLERQTITDDGSGAFRWITRWLEDVTEHQFRVIAIDAAGNEATATTLAATMVRRPDIPAVAVTLTDSALTLDITA